MADNIKWTKYLWAGLLSFAAFMLELFSIFVIEGMFLRIDIGNYTPSQRSIHSMITVCLWAVFIVAIMLYTHRKYCFPVKSNHTDKIYINDWLWVLLCLAGCKIMTFIDWHTLKIIGESRDKSAVQFLTQYIYYIFECALILLIIVYGQKAADTLLKEASSIPYGGILLAVTWGGFHFVSRGAGLELWNGISCMIFAVLSGFMYLKLKKRIFPSYLFIAVGYLL